MKRSIHIPKADRPAMAKRALEISRQHRVVNHAVAEIGELFDVSEPTARNMISYGLYLESRGCA